MLSSDTMLCLKWNNTSAKLNLVEAFQDLRNDNEFFDCSLGCADGSKATSIRAHKVILSIYSSVLKDMFNQHVEKNDPFVYLKGVSHDELSALIDFMYNGEVYVKHSNLNSFLAVANELRVQGLTEEVKSDTEKKGSNLGFDSTATKKGANSNNRNERREEFNFQNTKRKLGQNSLEDMKPLLNDMKLTGEDPLAAFEHVKNAVKKQKMSMKTEETNNLSMNEDENNAEEPSDANSGSRGLVNIENFISKLNKSVSHGKKKRKMAKCKICGKEDRADNIQKHIRNNHRGPLTGSDPEPQDNKPEALYVDDYFEHIDKRVQQGTQIRKFSRCKICSKEFRRDHIRMHIRSTHSSVVTKASNFESVEENTKEENDITTEDYDRYN